jgi:uncharacterized protein YecT (DUF1311 family)
MRSVLIVGLLMTFASQTWAAEYELCYDAGNTLQINDCLIGALEKADAELNRTYQRILKELEELSSSGSSASGDAKAELIKAQDRWNQFRDLDCGAVYESYREGSIRNTKHLVCKIRKAKQRTEELKEWWLKEQ